MVRCHGSSARSRGSEGSGKMAQCSANDPRYPTFTNGWFQVAWSCELAAGQVRNLKCFGAELVLFRGHGGVASVVDAYCPHLGAHVGIGGRVVGDCVECPFHGWQFDGGGACTSIPYANKIP